MEKLKTFTDSMISYWHWFVAFVESNDKFLTAIGTLLIAIFTVVLAFATYFLYRATNNLVEGADENAVKQLRAYVFIKEGWINITQDGGGFVVSIVYKNFGQTPAYQYSTWMDGKILPIEDNPFPKSSKPLDQRVNRSIVGPAAETNATTRSTMLAAADLQAIRNGTKAIFIWGGLDYVDAFDRPRHFVFRTRMSGPEVLLPNGGPGWPLTPHPLGYDAN